ncbi:MAG: diguanylate cyclase [Ilumatobacteraceae bacterium]
MAVANGAGERSDGASRLDAHRLLDCVDDAILVLDPELRVIYANAATRDFLGPGSSEPTGLDPSQLVHTDDLDAAIGAFSTVVGRRTRCVARMRVRSGDDWRPVEVTFTDHCGDEHVGGVVLCFRNVTEEERYRESLRSQVELAQRNRLLHDQLRERQHFLSRLVRIQASISRRAPLHEVLDSIVDGAHQLLGDPVIGLELQHPDDPDTLTLVAGHGLHDRHVREHLLDRLGLGARAYATNRLAHSDECDDAHGHDAHDASGRTGHCGIAVPIRRAGQAIGSLIVTTDRTDRVYSVAECEVLQSLADHAGLAIMDAQTVESMHEAFTDALTGLPNRRLLVDRLRQSLGRSHRQDRPLAVMFIDLDGFKAINDGRGHGAGDRVLGEVAPHRCRDPGPRHGGPTGRRRVRGVAGGCRPGGRRGRRRATARLDLGRHRSRRPCVRAERHDRRRAVRRDTCDTGRPRGTAPPGRHRDVQRQGRRPQPCGVLRGLDGSCRRGSRRTGGRAPSSRR